MRGKEETSRSRCTRKQFFEFWRNCGKKDYEKAFWLLRKSWREDQQRHPETVIYLNNAKLEAEGAKYYTIGVVVPVLKDKDDNIQSAELARAVLRGVATAQTQFNREFFPDYNELFPNFPPGLKKGALSGKV